MIMEPDSLTKVKIAPMVNHSYDTITSKNAVSTFTMHARDQEIAKQTQHEFSPTNLIPLTLGPSMLNVMGQ